MKVGDLVRYRGDGVVEKDASLGLPKERSWFDDVVEARDALQKIGAIQDSGVDTHNLPWMSLAARATNPGAGNLLG